MNCVCDYPFVIKSAFCSTQDLLCHEEIANDQVTHLLQYLTSLGSAAILPSLIVCRETQTIIDGHHRYHALNELGVTVSLVTYVDYQSDRITTHTDEQKPTKDDVLHAASQGPLMQPKTTAHHFIDNTGHPQPIILLSSLFLLGLKPAS